MKSLRNAVAIAAGVMFSFVGVANAAQLIVFEQPLNRWNEEVSADFAVNRELGRAWVEVALTITDLGDGPPEVVVTPKAIEGLYYDSTRKQVLYRTGSEVTVCAEDAKFLFSTYLKKTGECPLTPRREKRNVDDGFNIQEQIVAKVLFEASTSSHAAAPAVMPNPMVVK